VVKGFAMIVIFFEFVWKKKSLLQLLGWNEKVRVDVKETNAKGEGNT